jgi:hypothetical protein
MFGLDSNGLYICVDDRQHVSFVRSNYRVPDVSGCLVGVASAFAIEMFLLRTSGYDAPAVDMLADQVVPAQLGPAPLNIFVIAERLYSPAHHAYHCEASTDYITAAIIVDPRQKGGVVKPSIEITLMQRERY